MPYSPNLLRNSIAEDKLIADIPQDTRVDFIEPQRNKRESTPLPQTATSTGTGGRSSCRGKQDLATKQIEQRLKKEIEKKRLHETLCRSIPVPEATESATNGGNCNTLKMVTGKPFGITKVGARIMSTITVGGHEVTRNLCEPCDQTIMHIDVYAD